MIVKTVETNARPINKRQPTGMIYFDFDTKTSPKPIVVKEMSTKYSDVPKILEFTLNKQIHQLTITPRFFQKLENIGTKENPANSQENQECDWEM